MLKQQLNTGTTVLFVNRHQLPWVKFLVPGYLGFDAEFLGSRGPVDVHQQILSNRYWPIPKWWQPKRTKRMMDVGMWHLYGSPSSQPLGHFGDPKKMHAVAGICGCLFHLIPPKYGNNRCSHIPISALLALARWFYQGETGKLRSPPLWPAASPSLDSLETMNIFGRDLANFKRTKICWNS